MVETAVEVSEDVGQRELCASIMSGELAREAVVTVTYQNRNAMSVYINMDSSYIHSYIRT